MLENKHNLTVDTQSKSIGNAFVEVVQNDNVALEVQIYNNNLLVDNTAYTYTLLSVLPSKERIIRQGEIGPNGYPVFYLGVEEMSEVGIVQAAVQVFDETQKRVTSYEFKYRVKEDLSTNGVPVNSDSPIFSIVDKTLLTEVITKSDGLQEQLNQLVINGDSSVEAAQARVNADGSVTYTTLKDRLDTEHNQLIAQLKDEFDNLQVGGVNLASFHNWELFTGTWMKDIKTYSIILIGNPSGGSNGISQTVSSLNLEPNTEYVFSYKIRRLEGSLLRIGGHIDTSFKDGQYFKIDGSVYHPYSTPPIVQSLDDENWHYVEYCFKTPLSIEDADMIYIQANRGNYTAPLKVEIKEIQLEKGNKATDWSPSLQDTQSQIDGLGARVLMLEGKIEELEGRILSLEGV